MPGPQGHKMSQAHQRSQNLLDTGAIAVLAPWTAWGLVGCFPGKERSQPEEAAQRAIGLLFGKKMSEPTQFLPLGLTREGPEC